MYICTQMSSYCLREGLVDLVATVLRSTVCSKLAPRTAGSIFALHALLCANYYHVLIVFLLGNGPKVDVSPD